MDDRRKLRFGASVSLRSTWIAWGLSIAAVLGLGGSNSACTNSQPVSRARCSTDADCPSDETCLVDLTLDESYCSRICQTNGECEPYQSCRGLFDGTGNTESLRACVDLVRECLDEELCNGLDDDCDETIDGPDCRPITGCQFDDICGLFVCHAPDNQPQTLCAPPNESAAVADFEACSAPSDCRNELCESGFCSPICNPINFASTCPDDWTCAQGLGGGAEPAHNLCQPLCNTSRDCAGPAQCVWREVVNIDDLHELICATPPPGKKKLGEACSGFGKGDAECESGLCFSCVCSKSCAPTTLGDCDDVDSDFICEPTDLRYGGRTFTFPVCSSTVSMSVCPGG